MREVIDIEALLIRAYREKQVDRRYVGDERSSQAVEKLIDLGAPFLPPGLNTEARVDSSPFATKRIAIERRLWGQVTFRAEPLMRMHDAVLALPNFFLEPLDDLDFTVWDDETARRNGHVITAAAYGGTFTIKGEDHAARRVTRIIPAPLLIRYARSAERPDPSPVIGYRGRPIYDRCRKHVVGYATEWETPLHVVVAERAEYAVWHACLDMLAQEFRVTLPELDVQRPAAPAQPWADTPDVLPTPFQPKKRGAAAVDAARKLDSEENACA